MEKKELSKLVTEVVLKTLNKGPNLIHAIPIAVSNRHVHLSPSALDRLFGKGYQLQKAKDLSQPGQFAAQETLTLIGPKGKLSNVRVLGPARGDTQAEVSIFDGYTLGVSPPIRDSGDIENTPSIILQGPKGQLKLAQGLICAARHIHMHPSDAAAHSVKDGDRVQVKVEGKRGIVFDNVLIRISSKYRLEMHIDVDEANAAAIKNGQLGVIIQ